MKHICQPIVERDPWHERGRDDGGDVGARVEQARRERALARRKPAGDRLDARGKIPALTRAERHARDGESAYASDEAVSDGRETPADDRDRVAELDADAVDEPAEGEVADGIRRLERRVDVAVLLVRPAQLRVEHGLEQRENLPVDVVDRRREEQQAADHPAEAASESRTSRLGFLNSDCICAEVVAKFLLLIDLLSAAK